MTRRETLRARVAKIQNGTAEPGAWSLIGCPVGGWGETDQAEQQIRDTLPRREDRSYAINDLIGALYVVDHADRYRPRDDGEAREIARRHRRPRHVFATAKRTS